MNLMKVKSRAWRNHLYRFSIQRSKSGSQNLVALNNLIEAPFQRLRVQFSFQLDGGENIIDAAFRVHLVKEPKPLLRERQRQADSSSHSFYGSRLQTLPRPHLRFDALSQPGYGWRFK